MGKIEASNIAPTETFETIRNIKMKLKCPLSGVSYRTNVGVGHGQAPHPVFYIPTHNLLVQNLDTFCTGKLSAEELHLFGCSLLHKLPVKWEEELTLTAEVSKNWLKYLEKLAAVVVHLETKGYKEELPEYHIDRRNKDIGNLGIYLHSINDTLEELEYGPDAPVPEYILREAEVSILRMLRGSISRAEKRDTFPKLMADWAAAIGEFPTTEVQVSPTETKVLKEYWKDIVHHVFANDDPLTILTTNITPGDLDELIEHCETNIEIGTIHSLALLRRLRGVRVILDEFRSPAPSATLSITKSNAISASFLAGENCASNGSDTINIDRPKVAIPDKEPIRKDYPNSAAYIRAKIAWQKKY